jgi:hypothetical protein
MLKTVLIYGIALAAGALLLHWLLHGPRDLGGQEALSPRAARWTEAILIARELGLVP